MIKKRGFTLAEVLITLGIVGVVAALTAPALVMSSRNEANAARLSVVVSNLENAFQSAIIQEGADNLYGTSLYQNGGIGSGSSDSVIANFVGHLGQYMIINGYKKSPTDFYGEGVQTYAMSDSGGIGRPVSIYGDSFAIETKNGAAIFMRTYGHTDILASEKTAAINAGCSLYTNAAEVTIDVNGKNGPNVYGRDIFWFALGENGTLYPYGGRDVNRITGDCLWDSDNRCACTDTNKGNGSIRKGVGCTARVIAEGYKINY